IVDAAEWPSEIDPGRALEAKQQAEERLANSTFRFEAERARADIARAECRLKARAFLDEDKPAPDAPQG
ncbi:MAG: hypothetical protein LBD13_00820, partial [Spirochaetaceae bacterium]|nr:hypothetical protein [Spirochaetaceae bacterium]